MHFHIRPRRIITIKSEPWLDTCKKEEFGRLESRGLMRSAVPRPPEVDLLRIR